MLTILIVLLGVGILAYSLALARSVIASRTTPKLEAIGLGAVVSFFDTLGIGCFAPTPAWFKFRIAFHTRSTSKFYGDDYAVESK